MYQKIAKAIREVDSEKIIFFEPSLTDFSPILGGVVHPVGFD